ncbi:MAG: prolyl oligopeptidase family serine peptidase [Deltaproteobacteria bacterium]|nr:prolyl oligopeptidase family serine peptidase [Deltaproteobacteria bacterium]
MARPKIAPYGSWKSPIAADLVAGGEVGLEQVRLDGGDIYWIERRSQEGGRKVIVRRTVDGQVSDVTPVPFNARTRVHEYGGGDYAVSKGAIVFSNFADQRLYVQSSGSQPRPLTPAVGLRYADGQIDCCRNLFFCVREDHRGQGEAINALVSVKLDGENAGTVLVCGNDFYSTPRLSTDGSQMAWLTWNHPNMPWDGTELWAGKLKEDGSLSETVQVAGGARESIFQPEWSPGGTLYFVSDRSGWWNLYRWKGNRVEAVCPMDAEFGEPQWVFGGSLYDFESEERIICSYSKDGQWQLAGIDTTTGALTRIATSYTAISRIQTGEGRALLIASSSTEPACIVSLALTTHDLDVLRRSREIHVDSGYVSAPRPIEFPTGKDQTAYGFFYPPQNVDFVGPADERPPLLVMSHGGPTSATSMSLRYAIQYWASRGIAVLDVNYGGSSGYGRAYRERLNGQWGIVDVEDCVNGAAYLVQRGEVDGNRLAIRGGSAGGYTTLCALTFRDTFRAGASHYGISDLEALAKDTHKFESRYLDKLIGPYPQRRDVYVERSPIHFTDRLACPMILFQGLEDKVVPPNQAEKMVEAVRAKGLPVAYLTFEGEQHGFRKAENIKRVLEAELYFYSKVFRFELMDSIETVSIENL